MHSLGFLRCHSGLRGLQIRVLVANPSVNVNSGVNSQWIASCSLGYAMQISDTAEWSALENDS